MAAFEYSVPFTLVTPAGSATFNNYAVSDGYFIDDITVRRDIRNPVDDVPQRSGGIVHPFFKGASFITVRCRLNAEAGVSTRRSQMDTLRGYLDRLVNPTATELVSSCRLKWTPSGANERMYDAVRLYDLAAPEGALIKTFEFTLVSPYPYALDSTQTTTSISAGASSTLNNTGNTAMWPVIKINGGTGTVTNSTSSESIVLSGATVSAYAEVDTFQETVFADGSGANLQGKITQTSTTFWALRPGNNSVSATTASVDVLWQAAWV